MKRETFKKGKNITFNLVEVIVIVLVTGLVVSIGSGLIIFKNYKSDTNTKEIDNSLKEFNEVYNNIVNSYVEDVNEKELIESAINGMFEYLGDSYSNYLNSQNTSQLDERLDGEYYGIGVEINNTEDGYVKIVNVFENTPAYKSGLLSGDIILKVDEELMTGKDASYVSNIIKTSTKENILLTYLRNGIENTVNINLEKVIIPSVTTNIYDNIGYLKISSFASNTFIQVKNALNDFKKNKIKSLVIDVRNNSGGYLESAFQISDLFIEKGKIIYQIKNKDKKIESFKAKTEDKTSYNIIVLINEYSASASEILAAALKESYGASLVGKKSFGKGTVQEVNHLSSGAMVKYTISYWLTPKGNSINETGLSPDVEVDGEEQQLNKALEILKNT